MILAALGLSAAAGTLSGTVRSRGGDPVPLATVNVVGHGQSATVTADHAGRYEVEVGPGSYRVQAVPRAEVDLVPAWAPSAVERCDGARFDVEGAVEGADVTLAPGARVAGTLLDPDGVPVEGALVTAVTDQTWPRTGATGPDGGFRIGGVVPGEVAVVFVTEAHPLQFAGGVFSATQVVPVPLSTGEALDLGPVALRPGVTLTGTVYAGEAPAAEGAVLAYSGSALREVAIGADGRWVAAGLPPGDATAWAVVPGFATTYHPDADRPAVYVPAADGEVVDGVDLWLPPEASLTGRLSSPEIGDWTGVVLSLINDERTVGVVARAEADGRFRFDALHGGRYTLHVNGASAGVADGPVRGAGGEPLEVEVPAGNVLELGVIEPDAGATVSGVVSEAGTGLGVPGAMVAAQSESTGEIRFVYTEPSGAYTLAGLGPGVYLVSAQAVRPCASDDGYVPLHYPAVPNPAFAEPVRVEAGDRVPWDPALPPDDDHDGMDDRWERRHDLDPTVDDGGLDPDRDGYTNLQEYLLGTDPHGRDGAGCGCGGSAPPSGLALLLLAGLSARRREGQRRASREKTS